MLVLSRNKNERVVIGDNIVITIIDVRDGKVRLGIEAPRDIPVHRLEVYNTIKKNHEDQDIRNNPARISTEADRSADQQVRDTQTTAT